MKKGLLISLPILFLIIVVGGVFLFNYNKADTKQASTQAFDPDLFNWQQNGKGGEYIVQMKGSDLDSPVKAKVLTDDNCDPDNEGLSHCTVGVDLENGQHIEFTMTHNMMNFPCLDLKSTVKISPYAKGWAKVKI